MNFVSQLLDLENQAIGSIRRKLQEDHFNIIDLCTDDDIEQQTEEFCDLPVMQILSDGEYKEYRVCRIQLLEDDDIEFHCNGYGEMTGEKTSAYLLDGYVTSTELLRLADLINNK